MRDAQIYNKPLYISVIVLGSLAYCALLYLLWRNVTSRKVQKTSTPEIVWKSKHLCLNYLCILHILTILNITWLLLKHTGAPRSREFCNVVNNLFLVNSGLESVFILVVMYCRYQIMNDVLGSRSWLSRCSLVLTKILVIAPLILLPFSLATYYSQYKPEDYNSCRIVQTSTVAILIVSIIVGTTMTFFGLFLWQLRLALKMSTLLLHSALLPNNRGDTLAKSATRRNLIVTCCIFFWPLGFAIVIHILKRTHDVSHPKVQQAITFSLNLNRLLNMLTINVALYGVFRDWWFFLCPRRETDIQDAPVLSIKHVK